MLKDAAVADFEKARAEWESALGEIPDEALSYLKPGDDYALGGLQVHVNWVLVHYSRILDGIIAGAFAQVAPLDPPEEHEQTTRKAKAGLNAGGRRGASAEMAALHSSVLEAVKRLPAENWSRKAPVIYGVGQEPYPTSPEDIVGWLSDHYREHVLQCPELVSCWRESSA
ncbi:MAG TPA: DinB family protein [Candidatus Limnocylindria bacterium]|nr:DinB family protein [Candidatus Limnocylindria bacterium]